MSEERVAYHVSTKTNEAELLKSILSPEYKSPVKPLGDRLLLKAIDKGPQEIGGIIIPEVRSQEGPREGYVLAVGSGIVTVDYGMGVLKNENKNLELMRGDRVFYNQYQAVKTIVSVNGKEEIFHIIHEDQIIGVFREWVKDEDMEHPNDNDFKVRSMWPGWWMVPRGNRVFIEWEIGQDSFLGGKLVKPDTARMSHFTGKVLGMGHTVAVDLVDNLKIGDRVFFDQFSTDLNTYNWVHDSKRYAIIRDYDIHCPVPPRVDVKVPAMETAGEDD